MALSFCVFAWELRWLNKTTKSRCFNNRGIVLPSDFIASEVSKGIAHVGMVFDLPIIFGIITSDTIEQAIERAGSKAGNKGWDAALSAIEMVNLFSKL